MKKDKLGRNAPLYYSEAFKRQVIEEYIRTGAPKMVLIRKYGIRYKSGIVKWMRALGYADPYEKVTKFDLDKIELMAKPSLPKGAASTEEELILLKKQLEDECLRTERY